MTTTTIMSGGDVVHNGNDHVSFDKIRNDNNKL